MIRLTPPISLIARAAAVTALFIIIAVAACGYQADFLATRAELGRKTLTQYDSLLNQAWQSDPYNSSLSVRYGQKLLQSGKPDQALMKLRNSASGVNHWQGWELQGMALEQQAFRENGTIQQARQAAEIYDRVLKVYPTYVKGAQRRALLGLKLGQWKTVDLLASQLASLDPVSNNGVYLKARAADGLGNQDLARALYSSLSASGKPATGSLFTSAEISRRLKTDNGEPR